MAIYYPEIEQGTDEWFRIRMGRPTASEFARIMTPKQNPTKEDIIRTLALRNISASHKNSKEELEGLLKINKISKVFLDCMLGSTLLNSSCRKSYRGIAPPSQLKFI